MSAGQPVNPYYEFAVAGDAAIGVPSAGGHEAIQG